MEGRFAESLDFTTGFEGQVQQILAVKEAHF
jgi:hypothetical protein